MYIEAAAQHLPDRIERAHEQEKRRARHDDEMRRLTVGGCTPRPRKLSPALASTPRPSRSEPSTSSVPPSAGRMCRRIIRPSLQPSTRRFST